MNRKLLYGLVFLAALSVVSCSTLTKNVPDELTDDAIEADIRTEIAEVVPNEAAEIGVDVKDGVVTLSGTVSESDQRRRIGEAARSVHGVKTVINNIVVRD